jgi:hypothetical protein
MPVGVVYMELNARKCGCAHAYILTGMVRSGTSMAASLLQAGGVGMGQRQLMAHAGNPKGHFENMDFLNFHRSVLRGQGIPDAGWVSSGRVAVPGECEAEARRLIEVSAAAAGPAGWGWKDPRTTLFLDFWNGLIPGAVNVFIYRTPWEVVDSIFRRGVSEDLYFRERPEEAVRIWMHYHRCLLEFMCRHPERSVLVALDAVIARPGAFFQLINERFGAALREPPGEIVDPALLHKHTGALPWATLVSRVFPESLEVLERLDGACSLRSPGLSPQAIAAVRSSENYSAFFQEWFAGHARARAAAKKSRLGRLLGRWTRPPGPS